MAKSIGVMDVIHSIAHLRGLLDTPQQQPIIRGLMKPGGFQFLDLSLA